MNHSQTRVRLQFNPNEMNRKAEFGQIKTIQNENTGSMKNDFVREFSLFYAPVERGLTIESKLDGTRFEDTITIAVRHNKAVNDTMMVKLGSTDYKIVKIQADDSNNYASFDKIILKEQRK